MEPCSREIGKVGKFSYAVVIPTEFVRKLKWQERQKVVLKLRGKNIVISDWRPKG